MAKIEVRTPEDLDKVFTDIFNLLYDIVGRVHTIEAEIDKMGPPVISPYIPPPVTFAPGKVTITATGTGTYDYTNKEDQTMIDEYNAWANKQDEK